MFIFIGVLFTKMFNGRFKNANINNMDYFYWCEYVFKNLNFNVLKLFI